MSAKPKYFGFTVIELLVVISIVAIVSATIIPVGSAFLVRNHMSNKTNELVSSLRTAQISSMNGKEDMRWGVQVTASQIKLYAENDPAFNQTFAIPASITITQDTVLFNKLTGNPDATATFTITSNSSDSTVITVNEVGTVDVN
ncbi:prepilin-type N-terminal cleavage/methylation domain-containing protein [Candidatus Woesebacteria bacterium]|nr:prepilin-type N-terminal cleavage/methylation domain-containing protein [Candidatus Woesebacteria bacterium]